MPTYNLSNPEPSDEAKKVAEKDRLLRAWLKVDSRDRDYIPFWDQTLAQQPGDEFKARDPKPSAWGGASGLSQLLKGLATEIDSWNSAATTQASHAASAKATQPTAASPNPTPKSSATAT